MNLKLLSKTILIFLFCMVATVSYAKKDVYLSLSTKSTRASIGLADIIPTNATSDEMTLSKNIKNVLESDLLLSRHFNVAVAENTSYKFDLESQFAYWDTKGISVLLLGTLSIEEETYVNLEVKLYDAESHEIIWEDVYREKISDYRYLAHQINDEIVRRFTGEEGIACTKIVFTNDSTKFKEVYLVDYDGYNLKRLTKDNRLNILPKWIPDSPQIMYTSYLYNNPDLFVIDILKNKRKALSTIQGLNSPATFSPDKRNIVATLSRGVYPNLYILDKKGVVLRRLTEGKHIDTSPAYSPNGREIAFISDRAGYPQLYIMDAEGVNLRRISTKGNCDSPTWSPQGDKIAFTMKYDDNFDIFLYNLPRKRIIRLTEGQGNNENPSWSQDGRFIVFASTRSGKSEIYIMGSDGSETRKLVDMSGSSFTPSWSQTL
ncbi:MAG: PD40 domain-containing protein [Elusimicrobia bacterium]|nr:PD40 domain-containing protein [Elusimicrobiota bacterium]